MPKKIIPTHSEFLSLFANLLNLGCARVSAQEILEHYHKTDTSDLRTAYKKKQRGQETCFRYIPRPNSPIQVIIWTTYIASAREAREHDAAWVIIYDKRVMAPVLFSFPIHRTKGFMSTLKRYVEVFIDLADHWPENCSLCKEIPTIRVVAGVLLGRIFCCPNGHALPKASLYQNISAKHKQFLESKYRAYDAYRRRAFNRAGVYPVPRVFMRSGIHSVSMHVKQVYIPHEEVSQVNPRGEEFPFNDLQYEDREVDREKIKE